MPELTRVQLVLVELALAAAAAGLAVGGAWSAAGIVLAAVLAVLAVVPSRRRWLYQHLLSWLAMVRRRQTVRGPGLQSMLGGYRVHGVPGVRGARLGAVHAGSTWTLALEIGLADVLNDDPPVPADQLAGLLQVEDVSLSSVRLLTVLAPSAPPPHAPPGPAPVARTARRLCVLTVDMLAAADAVAARGGTQAAVAQILRRCALRAQQVLESAGLTVTPLDEAALADLFGHCLGPVLLRADGSVPPSAERWGQLRVAGTWSLCLAASGAGPDLVDRLGAVAGAVPVPTVVTVLVVQRGAGAVATRAMLVVRLSGPGSAPPHGALPDLLARARAAGIVLQRLDGEQGRLLRASMPVGLGVGAA